MVIRSFHITNVEFGKKTSVKANTLCLNNDVVDSIVKKDKLITSMEVRILSPGNTNIESNTIMDIVPISTKVLGTLGEGITHTLTGVYVLVAGCDEDGQQMHEFGSSEGMLHDHLFFGRAGTPSHDDYIIHINVVVKGGLPFDRSLPNAIFRATDEYIQYIREALKLNESREATEIHEFFDRTRPGKKRVALVRQVAGQGAMYDNQLFSNEPSGFDGGISIINMANVPIILSPNEYRDGALRSMT